MEPHVTGSSPERYRMKKVKVPTRARKVCMVKDKNRFQHIF